MGLFISDAWCRVSGMTRPLSNDYLLQSLSFTRQSNEHGTPVSELAGIEGPCIPLCCHLTTYYLCSRKRVMICQLVDH